MGYFWIELRNDSLMPNNYELMALHADCADWFNNKSLYEWEDFCRQQIQSKIQSFDQLNEYSFANMAFVYIYGPEDTRIQCIEFFDMWMPHARQHADAIILERGGEIENTLEKKIENIMEHI